MNTEDKKLNSVPVAPLPETVPWDGAPLDNEGKPRMCPLCGQQAFSYHGIAHCHIHGMLPILWHKKGKETK